MAYRTAEQTRWKQMDFILGYEIKLSGSHPQHDICDTLAGRYPKDFVWTGWHPNDICYAVPIVATEEEYWQDEDFNPENCKEYVSDVPDDFKEWVADNAERIEDASQRGTLPYFLKDNLLYIENRKLIKDYNTLHSSLGLDLTPTKIQDILEIRKKLSLIAQEHPEYFAHGYKGVHAVSKVSSFMSTDIKGRISINFATDENGYNAGECLVSAFAKLKENKPLSRHEEYAIENLWHEILHNKSDNVAILPTIDSIHGFPRVAVETINQYIARRTYPLFLQQLGGEAIHQDWIMAEGYGYKETVANLQKILVKGKIKEDVFAHEAEKLLMKDYTNFDTKIANLLRSIYKGQGDIASTFNFIEAPEMFSFYIKNLEPEY